MNIAFFINMVFLGRIELPTYRLGGDCSIQLSYKNNYINYNIKYEKKSSNYLKILFPNFLKYSLIPVFSFFDSFLFLEYAFVLNSIIKYFLSSDIFLFIA